MCNVENRKVNMGIPSRVAADYFKRGQKKSLNMNKGGTKVIMFRKSESWLHQVFREGAKDLGD